MKGRWHMVLAQHIQEGDLVAGTNQPVTRVDREGDYFVRIEHFNVYTYWSYVLNICDIRWVWREEKSD